MDVCGGHGALAMLCLAHGLGQEAVIIDPSKPPSHQRLCHLDSEVGNEDFQLGNKLSGEQGRRNFEMQRSKEVLEVLHVAKLGRNGDSPCPGDAWSPFVDGEISYDQRPLQQVQQRTP